MGELEIIGKMGCGRCDNIIESLEQNNIKYKYSILDNREDADEIAIKARKAGINLLPIIIKEGKIIKINELYKYLKEWN